MALLAKLHTKNLFFLKGLTHAQDVLCVFCGRFPEAIDHVLLSCQFPWRLWSAMSKVWGVQLVLPGSLRSLFELWMGVKIWGKFMKKAVGIMFSMFWLVNLES